MSSGTIRKTYARNRQRVGRAALSDDEDCVGVGVGLDCFDYFATLRLDHHVRPRSRQRLELGERNRWIPLGVRDDQLYLKVCTSLPEIGVDVVLGETKDDVAGLTQRGP